MNDKKQSPCHACEQDSFCSRPCQAFHHWFRLQWRQLRRNCRTEQQSDSVLLEGPWYEWLE